MQDIAAHRVQRSRLVQVHHPLPAALRTSTAGMVIALADRDPPPAVGDVLQLQTQHLARSQPTV